MHLIVFIALGVFGGLWLWSWTERRRAGQRIGRGPAILAGALVCGVVAAVIIGTVGHHANEAPTTPLSDRDIAFLCRTGAAVPGHC